MPTKLPHLTDDHHFAIANVAARSSQMEIQIENTIEKGLRNQRKTAEFLLKNLGSDRIVKLLKAILLDAIPDEAEPIENVIKKINELRMERNEILHWTWHQGLKEGEAISSSARPFRKFRWKPRTPDQTQEIADLMVNVVNALLAWQKLLHERTERP